MACSAARSAAVTGSKPPRLLVLDASAVRKNGRMVSPERAGELIDEVEKSMAVMRAYFSYQSRP